MARAGNLIGGGIHRIDGAALVRAARIEREECIVRPAIYHHGIECPVRRRPGRRVAAQRVDADANRTRLREQGRKIRQLEAQHARRWTGLSGYFRCQQVRPSFAEEARRSRRNGECFYKLAAGETVGWIHLEVG